MLTYFDVPSRRGRLSHIDFTAKCSHEKQPLRFRPRQTNLNCGGFHAASASDIVKASAARVAGQKLPQRRGREVEMLEKSGGKEYGAEI